MTVKTDDVTKGRKDLDSHGRFRGEWVNCRTTKMLIVSTCLVTLFCFDLLVEKVVFPPNANFSFFTTRWVKNIMVSKSSCTNVEETGTSQQRNSNSFKNNKSPSSPTRWTRYECTRGENCVHIQQSHNACSCCVIYTFFSCFELLFLCFAQFGSSSHGLNAEKFHDTAM